MADGSTVRLLMNKFTSDLEDAKKDHNGSSLYKKYESIKEILEKKVTSSSMSVETKETLKECLNILLERLPKWGVKSKMKNEWHLSNITQKLNNIKDASPDPSLSVAAKVDRRTSEMWENPKSFGFADQMEHIFKALQQQNKDGFNAVGIVGIGGSGKTTLAHMLMNDVRVKKEFMPRIWVPLSGTLDGADLTKNVVQYLLQELGEEEFEKNPKFTMKELLALLHKQLSGKKYLIVFDDVWHINNWYEHLGSKRPKKEEERVDCLAYGLPKGYGGGVIVTGRVEKEVERMVEKENLHRVLPNLDDESCWSIFMNTVEEEKKVPLDHEILKDMKAEIVKKMLRLTISSEDVGECLHQNDNRKRDFEAKKQCWINFDNGIYAADPTNEILRLARTAAFGQTTEYAQFSNKRSGYIL